MIGLVNKGPYVKLFYFGLQMIANIPEKFVVNLQFWIPRFWYSGFWFWVSKVHSLPHKLSSVLFFLSK